MKTLRIIAAILAVVASACQSPGGGAGGGAGGGSAGGVSLPASTEPTYSTDAAFASYVSDFQVLARYYGKSDDVSNLAVVFNDSLLNGPSTVASCRISSNGQRLVSVRRSYWDAATLLVKQNIIFHELGHCMLLRPHRYDMRVSDLTPISLMYQYVLSDSLYNTYYNQYNDELFQYTGFTPINLSNLQGSETSQTFSLTENGCEHSHE